MYRIHHGKKYKPLLVEGIVPRMEPEFLTDWLTPHIPSWERALAHLKEKPDLHFLEIGSFDGRSACWLLQNILTHPTSTLTCVDPFEPFNFRAYQPVWPPPMENPLPDLVYIEELFDRNIGCIGATEKVIKRRGQSSVVLRSLPLQSYDGIYIDGSHYTHDVLRDTVLSWDLIKTGGILIFDDYLLLSFTLPYYTPRMAIDAFMACFSGAYEVISRNWQIILRKTAKDPNLTNVTPHHLEEDAHSERGLFMQSILRYLWNSPASQRHQTDNRHDVERPREYSAPCT